MTRGTLKAAALCGIAGPVIFAAVIVVLTFLERDFLYSLGWNPLTAATHDWPSGLALGPIGFIMTAVFIAGGLALVFLARALRQAFQESRAAPAASVLLALAGVAMCLLGFSTDPTDSRALPTLHGRIHDAAFAALGAALMGALLLFGFVFRVKAVPRARTLLSWITAALIVPSFTVKGVAFYFFLAACLAWCETAGFALLRRARAGPT